MIRRRIAMMFLPAILVLALAATLSWVFRTESGARWVWSWASGLVPGSLHAERLSGTLESGLTLQGFRYENDSARVFSESVRLEASFDWLSLAVVADSVASPQVTVVVIDPVDPEEESTLAESLADMALPIAIHLPSVRVEHLLVLHSDESTAVDARDVYLAARWHQRVVLEDAGMTLDGLQVRVSGTFEPRAPFRVKASASGQFTGDWTGAIPPAGSRIQADLDGNLESLNVKASLDQPGIKLEGRLLKLLTTPDSALHLTAEAFQWPLTGTDAILVLQAVSAQLAGTWNQYRLEAAGTLLLPDLPPATVRAVGQGNLDGIEIGQAEWSNELGELKASGPLSWTDGFRVRMAGEIQKANLNHWMAEWPEKQPLHGTLEAAWENGRIEFSHLDVQAGDSNFRLRGEGVFDPSAEILTSSLDWTGLQWPLGAARADFRSERGQLKLQGQPDDWTAAGTVHLQAADWPAGVLTLEGRGNRESARIQIGEGQVLGGRIAGELRYEWTGKQAWSTRIEATQLDISALASAFPGNVSGALSATGQMEPMKADVTIDRLKGSLRGQPVSVSGGIAFATGELRARDLRIVSGASEVQLDGDARLPEGIHIRANIDSLAYFVKDAGGTFAGEGRLSLDPDHPLLQLDGTGKELHAGSWRIDSITAATRDEPAEIQIDVAGFGLGERVFETVSLTAGGARPLDRIAIEAHRGATVLTARLAGTVLDWARLPSANWSGHLEEFTLGQEPFGSLVLEQPARLSLSPTAIAIERACMRGSLNGLSCLSLDWVREETLEANVNLDSVSLNVINLAVPTTLDFSQRMNGEIHWSEVPGQQTAAQVKISLTPGLITASEDSAELRTGAGEFGFRIENGQLLAGNLDLTLPEVGAIDTDFRMPEVSLMEDSPIEGRLQIMLSKIDAFSDWIPGADGLEGAINADVLIGGTASNPALTGYASLVRGRVEIEPLGVTVSNVQLAGAVFEHDYTTLTGSFTSGKGTGTLSASVKFAEFLRPEIAVELMGTELTVASVPDMTVRMNPDLKMKWRDRALDINGHILIPYARISPRYLPTTNASESDDLVIVAGQRQFSDDSLLKASRLRINGTVTVELGDQIGVSFQRAKAQLKGKTAFTWNNDLIPVGDGVYTVSGKISAYGQALEVADGRVSFPQVPANNPHLSIKAEREIYGNVQIKKAGVLITGTLKRPVLETYTSPVTTEERALALLITGHDFDYDQGVGAVEVGLYIAPKLYVSYGIGLFEPQSVISVRYDLKHGFGIKATSGQRETGADISYTIER